jgi:hypothetical protein
MRVTNYRAVCSCGWAILSRDKAVLEAQARAHGTQTRRRDEGAADQGRGAAPRHVIKLSEEIHG